MIMIDVKKAIEVTDRIIDEIKQEWMGNQSGCNCDSVYNPPCGFCASDYSLPLEIFVSKRLEEMAEFEPVTDEDRYDKAMKGVI